MLNKEPTLRPRISEIINDDIFTQNKQKSEHKIVLNNMRKCTVINKLIKDSWKIKIDVMDVRHDKATQFGEQSYSNAIILPIRQGQGWKNTV